MALALLFLLVQGVRTQEVATPASLLGPRNYNHHAYDGQYLQELGLVEPTKQGPVLFPNDSPPGPRPPLIVTSRPLIESLARSELNNSLAQQTQINRVTFKPGFLARVKDYKPFTYPIPTVVPLGNYGDGGYTDVLKKAQVHAIGRDRYNDYETQSVLPPIYKVLSDNANQNVFRIQQRKHQPDYDYQIKDPSFSHKHTIENDSEDDQGKNYAFSYTVKDQKTGDDFSHSQQSSGSATNGEYRVRLPDGRMQIVSYTADENGYKADVRYDDEDKTSSNSIDNHYNDNTRNHFNDKYESNDRHDYTNNYIQSNDYKTDDKHKYKTPENDYYNQYNDNSKEYYNDDFSSEYDSKSYDYEPHRSKYTAYNDNNLVSEYKNKYSTVKPSYDQLKDLLIDEKIYSTVQPYKSPVEINVPSTTSMPFDATTERVVIIGQTKPTLYTNIRNSIPVSPFPILSNFVSSTPRSYLVSTIANLKNRIDSINTKPILSDNFINRINKYLSFN